jgi:hypothetical protein
MKIPFIMITIVAYDITRVAPEGHNHNEMTLNALSNGIKSFAMEIPDYLLARTVVDKEGDNFGGIETFLRTCVENGQDHVDTKVFPGPRAYHQSAKETPFNPEEVIHADPMIRNLHPKNQIMRYLGPGSVAFLLVDGRAYKEITTSLYGGQRSLTSRKQALHSIILCDARGNPKKSDGLRIELAEGNVKEAVETLQENGYFK